MSVHNFAPDEANDGGLPHLLQHQEQVVKYDGTDHSEHLDLTNKGTAEQNHILHQLLNQQLPIAQMTQMGQLPSMGQPQLDTSIGGEHGLQIRGDAYAADDSSDSLAMGKRGMEDELARSYAVDLSGAGDLPDRKKRKTYGEQQQKRHRYDVLKSFFRVYFREDAQAMVLKDAIYNLYIRKIATDSRIARNAMYRHMWTFFKEKISAFQSNYREYVKGIKMVSSAPTPSYDGFDKDIDLLTRSGVTDIFDFDEEELGKNEKPAAVSNNNSAGSSSSYGAPTPPYASEPDTENMQQVVAYIEQLENTANNLVRALKDLKAKIKKKAP